jgi:polyhydroxyalkanoate synthesis regulator phasin
VTTLPESDVHDIEESEHVHKAEVDEDVNESRLQWLKDRPAASDNDAERLRDEIEVLEQRIDDLRSVRTGTEMLT